MMWATWWVWGAASLVLAILEVVIPGFMLAGLCRRRGAGRASCWSSAAGFGAWLAGSLPMLLVVFAVGSLVTWLVLRRGGRGSPQPGQASGTATSTTTEPLVQRAQVAAAVGHPEPLTHKVHPREIGLHLIGALSRGRRPKDDRRRFADTTPVTALVPTEPVSGPVSGQLGQDRLRGGARVGGLPDRPPDHDVIGAVGNGLRRGAYPFLVAQIGACGAHARRDDQRARRFRAGRGSAAASCGLAITPSAPAAKARPARSCTRSAIGPALMQDRSRSARSSEVRMVTARIFRS